MSIFGAIKNEYDRRKKEREEFLKEQEKKNTPAQKELEAMREKVDRGIFNPIRTGLTKGAVQMTDFFTHVDPEDLYIEYGDD